MSIFCVSVKIMQEEGMVLHNPFEWLKSKTPDMLHNPLFDCVYCFGSFWGSVCFWTIQVGGEKNQWLTLITYQWLKLITYWIISIICTVYLNGVIYNGFKHERDNV